MIEIFFLLEAFFELLGWVLSFIFRFLGFPWSYALWTIFVKSDESSSFLDSDDDFGEDQNSDICRLVGIVINIILVVILCLSE